MSEVNYIERYWRDATPEDAIKEPPMVARFKDFDCDDWQVGNLLGFTRATEECPPWFSEDGEAFDKCQVYDAPDPGEGWRLIDTETEKGEVGDEFLTQSGVWLPECRQNGFKYGVPYRRRITPTVTYIPFVWEDREQLRGRWIKFKNGREVQCTKLEPVNHGGGMVINCYTPLELLESATFLNTGKPVGKEVTSAN